MAGSRDHREAAAQVSATAEDLLGQPTLVRRLAIAVLVCLAAATVLAPWVVAGWACLFLAGTAAEQKIISRRGHIGADVPGFTITFAMSVLMAAIAAPMLLTGGSGNRLFAIALISFSSVNVLLRFYNAPKLFLAAVSPHMALLCWAAVRITNPLILQGEYLKALTPAAVLGLYALMLLPMRRKLAAAWQHLSAAKQAAESASQAKSEFLATMSHEIRTPLNGVLGMAQAMAADPLQPAQKERLRVIRRSGETLLSILNDVLDLSKIEEGQLRIEADEFDMEHVTRGAVATFTPLASAKGLDFEFSIAEPARGVFVGDSVRLRQILYNLASNAVKFTERGRIGVCVSYQGGRLMLEVADSGVGIAPERVDALFEKFVQGDGSTTRRHGGTGLGLTICRNLAELMGGWIEVSSAPGRGSIFTVTIPMERVRAPAPMADTAAPEPEETARPIRVLAAEDNAVNQLVLKTLLTQAGIEPTVVENGAEALAAWEAGAWDMVLMDIQMPLMDGVAATREIRARELAQGRPRTPIIAVTANAMTHQTPEYIAAGMDFVVPKPLDASALFSAIEQALDGEAADDESAAAA